jgi:putative phosphoribosyl transferase
MGAIGEDGISFVNEGVVRAAGVTADERRAVELRERAELERRAARYRRVRPRVDLAGRTAILVDDGIATGSTARAACAVARAHGARRVVLAAPVAPLSARTTMRDVADELVFVETPAAMDSVGRWYDDFSPTSDDEVLRLLGGARPTVGGDVTREVVLPGPPPGLPGTLRIPARATGLVLFAHGSDSSRHSPRNQYVASVLHQAGAATLLFDLLSAAEARDRRNVFDVALLGARLADATRWALAQPELAALPIGYFGASTGAAAAMWAAAEPDLPVAAIVSRGGRPDLTGARLGDVRAPTLLIVGGNDEVVIDLNRRAAQGLRCEHRLVVVPGATHLFPEPGALEAVAALARAWFGRHLTPSARLERGAWCAPPVTSSATSTMPSDPSSARPTTTTTCSTSSATGGSCCSARPATAPTTSTGKGRASPDA